MIRTLCLLTPPSTSPTSTVSKMDHHAGVERLLIVVTDKPDDVLKLSAGLVQPSTCRGAT